MATPLVLPELGENIESGIVVKILVKVGDKVKIDQPVVEIETDKAVIEVPSETSGIISEIFVRTGDKIRVSQKILSVETADGDNKERMPENQPPDTDFEGRMAEPESLPEIDSAHQIEQDSPNGKGNPAPAAPSVRRFAREIGIDIHAVQGSGPGSRISRDDVKTFAQLQFKGDKGSGQAPTDTKIESLPDFTRWGQVERQPMGSVRKKTASRLSYAWSVVPHVTHFDKADITQLEAFRKAHGYKAEAAGGKLTMTAILLKIAGYALKRFPQFNSSVDMGNQEIIYKKYINIGIAVDTDRGLIVPVVQEINRKNLIELSKDLSHLAAKARTKKLTIEEMQGGCFTISNLGGIGGSGFTPIVNPPEVAILGVSRSQTEAVYIDGQFQPRLMLPLALSYDHRVIDGADAARFLHWMVEAMEQPMLLTLDS